MAVFGFLQDSDLQPLRERITTLEFDLKIQNERVDILKARNDELTQRIQNLEQFCYNLGGDVALLQRKVTE